MFEPEPQEQSPKWPPEDVSIKKVVFLAIKQISLFLVVSLVIIGAHALAQLHH